MVKSRKKAIAPEPTPIPRVGDKVTMPPSNSIREITHVSASGDEVNLHVPGTNLEWFRVRTDKLKFIERNAPPKTSNPFTEPEPVLDAEEVLIRIDITQRENLQKLDDDIDALKGYLKTQETPKSVTAVLETLTTEQHKTWDKAVEKIEKLLNE